MSDSRAVSSSRSGSPSRGGPGGGPSLASEQQQQRRQWNQVPSMKDTWINNDVELWLAGTAEKLVFYANLFSNPGTLA